MKSTEHCISEELAAEPMVDPKRRQRLDAVMCRIKSIAASMGEEHRPKRQRNTYSEETIFLDAPGGGTIAIDRD